MGKASKWLKGLLAFKKPDPAHSQSPKPHSKRRWSFAISHREKDRRRSQDAGGYADEETSRHAIAVAAASTAAAAAEAAVTAAQAAAAVVKLTSGGGGFNSVAYVTENGAGYGRREESAAVMIQSHFRAYLARRALRALKALVMLQALVRGQILRKHYVQKLRQMQEIVWPTSNSSPLYHYGQAMQERLDYTILARNAMQDQLLMLKRNGSRSNSCNDHYNSPLIRHTRTGETSWEQGSFTRLISTDDERNDKILEVDTWKPKRSNQYFQSFSASHDDDNDFATAENSPHYYSASSMEGGSMRTPTKNDGPSYMAYTESSKAKVRSLSAPKQRPPYERSSSTNRYSVHGYGDSRPNKASALHANFTSKVYSGSGRLDRLGMPVRGDVSGFSGGHWHRY